MGSNPSRDRGRTLVFIGVGSSLTIPHVDMVKIRLLVAYDGTNYAGWQVQKVGVGVQEKIEDVLRRLFGSGLRLHSSSRTDSGVHALGMVAHLEMPRAEFKMTPNKLVLALHAYLTDDNRVM